ncbi:hypothetical protein SAMN06295967_1256 [Belliella buryatensis]|uniref:RiboL-PSP-HEPN domain-containing protein n=1 Tax=Belliella buryatensis TaxID=1500549 RepID=A0A239H4V2_9BACT|nr:hypothetical protein [Belliella buryatensis]SNS76417.1 hypothetical protein SAMN06295967_1256 [Belliella buryatensis]
MAEFDIPAIALSYVKISFQCNNTNCYGIIKSDLLQVPLPNSEGENHSESLKEEDYVLECPVCSKKYGVFIGCGFGGAYVNLPDIDEDETKVDILTFDDINEFDSDQIDAFLTNPDSLGKFMVEIGKLRFLINLDFPNEEIYQIIYKLTFSGAITCLEEYLADLLINKVLRDDDVFWKYFDALPDSKNTIHNSIKVKKSRKGVEELVKKKLLNTLYHRIVDVDKIYSTVFDISFPAYGDVCKIIQDRHDMVHRNGKTKDGVILLLHKGYVNRTIDTIARFVEDLDNRINGNRNPDLPF